MTDAGFSASRTFYIVLAGLIALLGLFAASRASDTGFALFGWALVTFGYAFGFWMLHRSLPGRDAASHAADPG